VAKTAFEQVECAFMFGPRAPSGPETHNNVKDKTETGRDSVHAGFCVGEDPKDIGKDRATESGVKKRANEATNRAGNTKTQEHTFVHVFTNQCEPERRRNQVRDGHSCHREPCADPYRQEGSEDAANTEARNRSHGTGDDRCQSNETVKSHYRPQSGSQYRVFMVET
jgi:hypothetical protein